MLQDFQYLNTLNHGTTEKEYTALWAILAPKSGKIILREDHKKAFEKIYLFY